MLSFVRELSPRLQNCELSFVERAAIDIPLARRQHAGYVRALGELGCEVRWLAPLAEHPDGVFVEDTAVLVPGLAVIARPGALSRRGEVASVAAALEPHVALKYTAEPATLEGGDVLRIGRRVFVGSSARSNAAGVAQLGEALAPAGYSVQAVAMTGCLHLKSAATFSPPDLLVVNPDWVDPAVFGSGRIVPVAPEEPFGANTLSVAGVTLVSADYPETARRLAAAGVPTRVLEVGELHKAEAALTCMSLVLEPQ